MLRILLDTSPLQNGNAHRGVGQYTHLLAQALEQLPDLELARTDHLSPHQINPDVVHYPFFDLFFPTLPLWRKQKTVVTIHDVIPLVYPDYYPTGKKGALTLWRQKMALKSVSAVITDSLASAADIVRYLQVPTEKIAVVPLAANPALKPVSPAQVISSRKRWSLPRTYILYVGDINYNKNIPQLIKTLKFLPNKIHLVCVGKNFYPHDIPEWRWIEAQIALSDVTERVHFITDLGSTELELLSALYQQAVAYVQPSRYEGFGLPLLEALQVGTPVVASASSSLLEVGGEQTFFAQPTAEALAAAINQVLELDQVTREKIIRLGQDWSARFTWQKTADQTAAVYRSLCPTS